MISEAKGTEARTSRSLAAALQVMRTRESGSFSDMVGDTHGYNEVMSRDYH